MSNDGNNTNSGKKKLEDMTDHELLVRLVQKQTANARDQKITAIACACLGIIFAVALTILVPKIVVTLEQVNQVTTEAQTVVTSAQQSLKNVDELMNNVNGVVDDNSEYINEAMKDISNIDFEGLNQAINDLKNVVEPLAKLFGAK